MSTIIQYGDQMSNGIFENFIKGKIAYLQFMNLWNAGSDADPQILERNLSEFYNMIRSASDEQLRDDILKLIRARNWRSHLVACMALLAMKVERRNEFIDELWKTLSNYSWASPQIAVTLSMIDPEFQINARRIPDNETGADEKAKAAMEFLLAGKTEDFVLKEGSRIAKRWSERLNLLSLSGKVLIGKL